MAVAESLKDFSQQTKERLEHGLDFLRDVRKELNNVSWPSRSELTGTTVVVIVTVFFFGFFLYVVDLFVNAGMHYIFRSSP